MKKQNLQPIIEKARGWGANEIKKHGTPALLHIELANSAGQRLAKKFRSDEDIVLLGTLLMDVKLGECLRQGKIKEHIKRGVDAAKSFLKKENVDSGTAKKILACIEEHHGARKFSSKESEIVANADCYRFLHPKGIFVAFDLFSRRFNDFYEAIAHMENKMDEKYIILSIPECKKELTPHYKYFKKIIAEIMGGKK